MDPAQKLWGTPLVTGIVVDLWPLSTTRCFPLDKSFQSILKRYHA